MPCVQAVIAQLKQNEKQGRLGTCFKESAMGKEGGREEKTNKQW